MKSISGEASKIQYLSILNTSRMQMRVIIEPWAEELFIQPNATLEIEGKGATQETQFTLEYGADWLIISGSSGATISLFVDGKHQQTGSSVIAAPDTISVHKI